MRNQRERLSITIASLCAFAAFATLACGPASCFAGAVSPSDAKAGMIWNLLRFVEWPATASKQITITILGEDDLAGSLASTVGSRTLGGRAVFVRFTNRPQDVRGSQVVYVATSAKARWVETLAHLKGEQALTFSDQPGFLTDGGMVDFVPDSPRLRFGIHVARVEQAGLKISSKVLALAQVARDATPGAP